jgi:hypothetical protein
MDSRSISSSGGPGQISPAQLEQFQKTRKAGLDAAADTLGESVDDLQSELASGKSLTDIAGDHGVSPDRLLDAVKQAVKSSDGNLSDNQVDNIAKRVVSGHHHHHGARPPEATPPATDDGGTLPPNSTISVKA